MEYYIMNVACSRKIDKKRDNDIVDREKER